MCTHFSDNNECTLGTHNCHTNSTCINADGSFTCACSTGYIRNGVTCAGKMKFDVFVYLYCFLLSHGGFTCSKLSITALF